MLAIEALPAAEIYLEEKSMLNLANNLLLLKTTV